LTEISYCTFVVIGKEEFPHLVICTNGKSLGYKALKLSSNYVLAYYSEERTFAVAGRRYRLLPLQRFYVDVSLMSSIPRGFHVF